MLPDLCWNAQVSFSFPYDVGAFDQRALMLLTVPVLTAHKLIALQDSDNDLYEYDEDLVYESDILSPVRGVVTSFT